MTLRDAIFFILVIGVISLILSLFYSASETGLMINQLGATNFFLSFIPIRFAYEKRGIEYIRWLASRRRISFVESMLGIKFGSSDCQAIVFIYRLFARYNALKLFKTYLYTHSIYSSLQTLPAPPLQDTRFPRL